MVFFVGHTSENIQKWLVQIPQTDNLWKYDKHIISHAWLAKLPKSAYENIGNK